MSQNIPSPGLRGIILMLCCLVLVACGGGPPPDDTQPHNSKRFEGTLPCPDCSGIATTLILERDDVDEAPATFYLHEIFIDSSGGERVNTSWGDWSTYPDSDDPDSTDTERRLYLLEPEVGKPRRYLERDNGDLQPLNTEGDPLVDSNGEAVILESSAPDPAFSPTESLQ